MQLTTSHLLCTPILWFNDFQFWNSQNTGALDLWTIFSTEMNLEILVNRSCRPSFTSDKPQSSQCKLRLMSDVRLKFSLSLLLSRRFTWAYCFGILKLNSVGIYFWLLWTFIIHPLDANARMPCNLNVKYFL